MSMSEKEHLAWKIKKNDKSSYFMLLNFFFLFPFIKWISETFTDKQYFSLPFIFELKDDVWHSRLC